MARFHAVTWQDGNFDRTASVLSFTSKKARAAFSAQCSQRFDPISSKKKAALLKEGRVQRLALWDKTEPTKFAIHVA